MTQISIIGTRACGKTTYLAALALCPHQNEYPGLQVTPIGHAEYLAKMANEIIRRHQALPPNRKEETRKKYEFEIEIPKLTEPITLSVKDSSGELFNNLVLDRKDWEPGVQAFVRELCQPEVTGWIIMTDWIKELDTKIYQPALKNLLAELNLYENYNNKKNKGIPRKRIAVMMSKCERGEAWTGRLDPGDDLFRLRLPETYKELQKQRYNPKRIDFFACSSFGVLRDKNPRPNRLISSDSNMREYAYLLRPSEWRPYGLFSPLYWLVKGSRYWDESM